MKRRRATRMVLVLGAGILVVACGQDQERFGKTLAASWTVPADTLDQFAQHAATPRDAKLSTLENVAMAEGVTWSAPAIDVTTRSSPYRLAIRVEAAAVGSGSATSMWLAGWGRLDEDGMQEGVRASIVANLGDGDLPPDKWSGPRPIRRAGASAPVTFRKDGSVIPVIDLKSLHNMKLERVDVEVWSGIDSPTWRELLFGWQSALIGLVMLVLWFRWFRKQEIG